MEGCEIRDRIFDVFAIRLTLMRFELGFTLHIRHTIQLLEICHIIDRACELRQVDVPIVEHVHIEMTTVGFGSGKEGGDYKGG